MHFFLFSFILWSLLAFARLFAFKQRCLISLGFGIFIGSFQFFKVMREHYLAIVILDLGRIIRFYMY